ncbi:YceH family protein [Pelovirga terrestris]|uniref:YceH family protein n=1 Tax=Pelovirga terrestris TaxID=2771352 RepID=A0A8J6QXL4_9BACT|nr:YceH family protein [Pelovirga terrestris]MBD1400821.1 YceH family protein [Pelovirga terrestris]
MYQQLSPVDIRILGALVEKELATPEYYPLSLNALTNACNQKSNRDPVMVLTEEEVVQGLDNLRRRQLIYRSAEGVRTQRYCHHLEKMLHLERKELAVLAILLLRGPQTIGEIRTRCERMVAFADLAAVEAVMNTLSTSEPPLVTQLARQPGRKECRYIDRLRAETSEVALAEGTMSEQREGNLSGSERLTDLEEKVSLLEQEISRLQEDIVRILDQFDEFKSQLE